MSTKGKDGGGGGRNWKTGIHTYTLLILYVKQITNENTGFPAGSVVKKKKICLQWWRCKCGFDPWVGKIPWRRKWQPTPVFLPGKSHGQRSLTGYSPLGCRQSGTTEHKHTMRTFCTAQGIDSLLCGDLNGKEGQKGGDIY